MLNRKSVSAIATALAFVCCMSIGQPRASAGQDSAQFTKCQRACLACAKACAACYKHCTEMVKSGDKTHEASAKMSLDCLAVCNTTATIVERRGPMTKVMCDACAKACDACGTECAKFPTMAEMAACKKECDACMAVCKTML